LRLSPLASIAAGPAVVSPASPSTVRLKTGAAPNQGHSTLYGAVHAGAGDWPHARQRLEGHHTSLLWMSDRGSHRHRLPSLVLESPVCQWQLRMSAGLRQCCCGKIENGYSGHSHLIKLEHFDFFPLLDFAPPDSMWLSNFYLFSNGTVKVTRRISVACGCGRRFPSVKNFYMICFLMYSLKKSKKNQFKKRTPCNLFYNV
jgi:hypothetical protein